METFQQHRENALKHTQIADHMLSVTYPLLKDPKLLITVLSNIYESIHENIRSLISYEVTFKRINDPGTEFQEELRTFTHLVHKYQMNNAIITTFQELHMILKEHKESPMEFSHKETFVMYTDNDGVKTLAPPAIEKYLEKAKSIQEEIKKLTHTHEGLFR